MLVIFLLTASLLLLRPLVASKGKDKEPPKQLAVSEKAAVVLKNGLGEISRPCEGRGPRAMAEFSNAVQKAA